MNEEQKIISILESQKPTLSKEERSAVWSVVAEHLPVSQVPQKNSIVSPYSSLFAVSKQMTVTFAVLTLVLCGGGTALASEASRPGDLLFPLERTLEDVQLRLARSEESRTLLSERFTKERLAELREIVDEELVVLQGDTSEDILSSFSKASSTPFLEIEADVFTDTTVVKMEVDDKKFYFETTAKNRESVIAAIAAKFPQLQEVSIASVLDFEMEDRASVPRDRGIASFSDSGKVRVDKAITEVLRFLDGKVESESLKSVTLSQILKEVGEDVRVRRESNSMRIDSEDDRLEIRMDDDGDSRFEVRSGSERIRIESKDGELRVKKNSRDDLEESDLNDRIRDDSSSDTLEVEADVFSDTTTVVVEQRGRKSSFVTTATSKDAVASEVARRYNLSKALVLSVIDFEVEDRPSRVSEATDNQEDQRDDREDDNNSESSDDDRVEDADDSDNSGHGGGSDDEDDEDEERDEDDDNSGHGGGDN